MMMEQQDLFVAESGIPGAGKGLFTNVPFSKGNYIVEYTGRRTTWEEVEDDYSNGYICCAGDDFVIDGKWDLDALARYANDARGLSRVKGTVNNARYVVDGNKVYLEATKPIAAGEEIFVSYGKQYWDTIRANQSLEEAEI